MTYDLTGQKFSHLTVLEETKTPDDRKGWKCKCDCGNTVIVRTNHLTSGHYISCGCTKRVETEEKKRKKHTYEDLREKNANMEKVIKDMYAEVEYWKAKADKKEKENKELQEENEKLKSEVEYYKNKFLKFRENNIKLRYYEHSKS